MVMSNSTKPRVTLILAIFIAINLASMARSQTCFKVLTCDEPAAQQTATSVQGPPGKQGPQGLPGRQGPRGARGSKGSRGEGADEFFARIEILERKLAALTSPTYVIKKTPRSGSFEETRDMCRSLGGDLVTETLKEKNRDGNYRSKMDALLPKGQRVWIGMSDVNHEGTWTMLDGTIVEDVVYSWQQGQPNNHGGNQNCGEINNYNLYDSPCSLSFHGLCEILVTE